MSTRLFFHLYFFLVSLPLVLSFIEGESSQYILSDPKSKYQNDDYSIWTPPLEKGGRIIDLLNGEFLDEHLRDTPDSMRPPTIILFYNSSSEKCMKKYNKLNFEYNVYNNLPSRAFLFIAKYDIDNVPKRTWYKFIPERDLKSRYNINKCPSIVFLPPECNGFTKWCEKETINDITYLGCDNYIDQCKNKYKIWTKKNNIDYVTWINNLIKENKMPALGGPKLAGPNKKSFNSMEEQERWLQSRDESTQRENYRNNWVSSALPAFSENGYKAVKMPEMMRQEYLNFYKKHFREQRPENWNSHSQTAVNGHEVEPSMVSLDLDMPFRDEIVNRFVKPQLEEWVGFPLRLTSHYGIREYYSGSWLKNHIDRIDVLIVSATQSIAQIVCNTTADGFCDPDQMYNVDFESGWPEDVKWPLEGVDWRGNNVRYDHPPGTIIFYESAKFIHGRPYPLPQHPNYPKTKYVHLGSFCHFTPADGSWKQIGHDTNARKNLNRHTKGNRYKDNPPYYPPPSFQQPKPAPAFAKNEL